MFNVTPVHIKWRRIIDSYLLHFRFSNLCPQLASAQTLPSSSIVGYRYESEDLAYPSQNSILFHYSSVPLSFCNHVFYPFRILHVCVSASLWCFQIFILLLVVYILSIYQELGLCGKNGFSWQRSLSQCLLILYKEYVLFLIFNIYTMMNLFCSIFWIIPGLKLSSVFMLPFCWMVKIVLELEIERGVKWSVMESFLVFGWWNMSGGQKWVENNFHPTFMLWENR